MKKKIIVVGAGHGAVTAAAILAEKGYDVTVFEKKKCRELGYDWCDPFRITCFDDAGIPRPPANKYEQALPVAYTNPAKTVRITMPDSSDGTNCLMDRKYLIAYLVDYAQKKGVKFRFDTQVISPLTDSNKVIGVIIKKWDKYIPVFADLVIDGGGIDSPVRSLLPSKFSIQNDFADNNIFTVYRAYYKRKSPVNPENRYTVHFFHMRLPGISWVVSHKDYFDILVGRFGTELTDKNIEDAVNDLKNDNPGIGNEIVRGGNVERIPLGRTLPLIIADGYAAVGDSASMTIPITGSGIANSIRAGKLLADAVIADRNSIFTCETLWKYQKDYFNKIGCNLVMADKLRELASQLTADDIDYILEKELLSQKELSFDSETQFNASYIIQKIIKVIPKLPVVANAAKTLARNNFSKKVFSEMPEKYEKQAVSQWCKKYSDI